MQLPQSNVRFWYQKPLVWTAIGAAGCLGFLAMPHARRIYNLWTGEKKVQRAKEALARRDFDAAVLNARGALATNQKDIEATRVMAKTAETAGANAAAIQFRRQLEALKPGDAENLFALAENCLKAGDPSAAEEAIKSLTDSDRASANYHDIASAIAWSRGDSTNALLHADEAVKLAPENNDYRLRYATLGLTANTPEARAKAVAELERLSKNKTLRLVALRALLGDALTNKEFGRARDLAAVLATSPGATFADKLTQLSTLNALRRPEPGSVVRLLPEEDGQFFDVLAKFQQSAAKNTAEIFELANWMNINHLALMAQDWLDTLPAEVRLQPPVSVALTDSHARSSNWVKLKETTESGNWGEHEFVRLAMLARSLERLQDEGGSTLAWNAALRESENRPVSRHQLAREALNWGWHQKAEELLWKLAENDPCPRWVADNLWSLAQKRRDAEALCKISKIILAAEPTSVRSRNSYISFLLLTEQEPVASHSMAEALYLEHPSNGAVAASYAYSLHLRGRPWEAVSVLERFPSEELRQPWLAFQYSTALVAAGEFDRAEEYLRLGAPTEKYPKQQALAEFLLAAFDMRQAEQRGDSSSVATGWKKAIASAKADPALLETLGKMAVHWGWNARVEEVVGMLAESERCPNWASEVLWNAVVKNGESNRLYKAAKLIMVSNPKDLSAQCRFLTVALLARNEADSPHRVAEMLAEANPAASEIAATYGFSLYRQRKPEQAISVFRKLQPGQLREPRTSFYFAIILAALGQPEEARQHLTIGITHSLLPEEKAIGDVLLQAFQCHDLIEAGGKNAAQVEWKAALAAAGDRSDLVETLARMAIKWEAPEKADEAFWILADRPDCPRWALDSLWASAEKRRDSTQLYKISRLLRKSDPNNVSARNNFVWLSLLTGQDAEFPHRQAEALRHENPGNADVAVTYALSLYQRGRNNDAIAAINALRPEQLRAGKPAFYLGLFLASNGENGKAREYLNLDPKAPLLPEEEALLAKATRIQ